MHCKYTNKTLKKKKSLNIWNFYTKRTRKFNKKENIQQKNVCLEQQIYTSPDNFTQALRIMLDPFRTSRYSPLRGPASSSGKGILFKSFFLFSSIVCFVINLIHVRLNIYSFLSNINSQI